MTPYEKLEIMRQSVAEAAAECVDTDLLDLVWKMMLSAQPAPTPDNIISLEVRNNVHYKGDKTEHRAVTVEVRGSVKYTRQDHTKVGNRRKSMPRVCGGADSLQSAA